MQQDQIRSSSGIVSVKDHRIALELDDDFISYYLFFIQRKYWVTFQKPLHGAHISIASLKHHTGVDWEKAKTYEGKRVDFDYSVDMIHGGRTKGFHMFYLKVFSEQIDDIKRDIGAMDGERYKGLHCTIGSLGKGNSPQKLWWPSGITLKS